MATEREAAHLSVGSELKDVDESERIDVRLRPGDELAEVVCTIRSACLR